MAKRPDAILVPPYLPMPYSGARRDEGEYEQYRERRELHLQADPCYDNGWQRPSQKVADDVFDVVTSAKPLDIDKFLSTLGRKQDEEELTKLRARAKLALVVTIDAAIAAGESGRLLTANVVLEALASAWSDWYRWSRAETPATSIYKMGSPNRVAWICRDLLMNGLWLKSFVKAAQAGIAGLYETKLVQNRSKLGPHTSYAVILDETRLLAYRAARGLDERQQRRRILLASDPDPKPQDEYEVAAERKYDVVDVGANTTMTITQLQSSRLAFDTKAFAEDRERLERTGAQDLSNLRAIAKEINALKNEGKVPDDGVTEIKTGVYKTKNRRYENRNFWIGEVTGKDGQTRSIPPTGTAFAEMTSSRRLRWFKLIEDGAADSIGGVDVSSSQIQTLAVFAGEAELEATCRAGSFWDMAAARAWEMHAEGLKFKFPDSAIARKEPGRLKESLKHAVMTHIYGQGFGKIADQLVAKPDEFVTLGDKDNIKALVLDEQLGLRGLLTGFRPAMQRLAKRAWEEDKYFGVALTDPWDQTSYRRNPWEPKVMQAGGSGVKIYSEVPLGPPNEAGDYRVNLGKLIATIGPCFTHSLDGLFASLVVDHLSRQGVVCLSIHDSWLVAWKNLGRLFTALPLNDPQEIAVHSLSAAVRNLGKPAAPVNEEHIPTVSEQWLRLLGPAYDDLERHLGDDPKWGPWAREIRTKWERRVEAQEWPQFRFGMVAPDVRLMDNI